MKRNLRAYLAISLSMAILWVVSGSPLRAEAAVAAKKSSSAKHRTKPKTTAKATVSKTKASSKPAAAKSSKSVSAKTSKSKTAKSKTSQRATARKSSTRRTTAKRQTRSKPVRYAQQKPTPDRLREIQEALSGRGYQTPTDGVWGQDSADALKKFQSDQKLAADGKLSSLTLIALGLGPRRNGTAPTPPATQKEEP